MPSAHSNKNNSGKGFTLIELLVSISIITLLSSVVLASLNGARNRAWIAKALFDKRNMTMALQSYYEEHDSYPASAWSISGASWGALGTALAPYLSVLPTPLFTPPPGSHGAFGYFYLTGPAAGLRLIDGTTGHVSGCVQILDNKGYWMSFEAPTQTSETINDGGVDPDGIESWYGNVQLTHGSC